MEQSKEITSAPKNKALTARSQSFLNHLAAGRPTLEAYSLAGYKGNAHAAYQLRSDLKQHLARLLEDGGFSREHLALEINKLNTMPLDPSIKNVNFKQKLDVLRLMEKALPKPASTMSGKQITPVRLNFLTTEPVKIESVETTAEESEPQE
jgi:hypothetical protein